MKRPVGVYFVVAWWVLVGLVQASGLARAKQLTADPISGLLVDLLSVAALGLVIWLATALAQLRPAARWWLSGWLGLWSLSMAVRLVTLPRFLPVFLVATALNILAIWYLWRPSYVAYCRQFQQARLEARRERAMNKQLQRANKTLSGTDLTGL